MDDHMLMELLALGIDAKMSVSLGGAGCSCEVGLSFQATHAGVSRNLVSDAKIPSCSH